ncbi:hypothetical protein SY88_04085 [Clostridiales bacterium PH28_bin88]|nr:hypothetical protein SY88_04085 [Clostridiales bacterium PH28_bin88]
MPPGGKTGKPSGTVPGQKSFQTVLEQELKAQPLKFSQHARQRMATRRIALTAGDLERLGTAVDKAAQKGARESLILMDDLALIVSVANRTVVTAVDGAGIKENVFTNIDSAVII